MLLAIQCYTDYHPDINVTALIRISLLVVTCSTQVEIILVGRLLGNPLHIHVTSNPRCSLCMVMVMVTSEI